MFTCLLNINLYTSYVFGFPNSIFASLKLHIVFLSFLQFFKNITPVNGKVFLCLCHVVSASFVSEEDYDQFCLAYMFTYRDFEMGTLGLAWTGDLKNAGGVCEKNGVSDVE
jgi:hypothetical protein